MLPSLELGIDPVTTGVELGKDTPLCNLWVAMLDRIGSQMEEVRRISDNIAHDLKTPLTRLRSSLELLTTNDAEEPERRGVLIEQSIAEADGLLSTFNALLRIARIDSGERRAAFAAVDLQRLLHDVVEDTAVTPDEVRGRFGDRVAGVVVSCSDRYVL